MKKIIKKAISLLPNKIRYFVNWSIQNRKLPDIFNPRDYREYLFRDILLGKNNKHAILADKYRSRKVVENKGLGHILPKLYGVWNDSKDIDFDLLPNRFVLKCNHGCGFNIICHDKEKLDRDSTRVKLNAWLKTKHPIYYETHYFKIKPIIFCEEFIDDNTGFSPIDYKFHCIKGVPLFIRVFMNRNFEGDMKTYTFNMAWEPLDIENLKMTNETTHIKKPVNLEKMIEYSRILSSELKHVRIDLYDIGTKVYFGEFTLTPQGGNLTRFGKDALVYVGQCLKA